MRKIKNILRRIRLVYRPSLPVLKLVVLVMVVVCTVTLVILGAAIHTGQKRNQEDLQRLEILQQENRELTRRIGEIGSVQSVVRIAREELGLENPDAVIFEPVETTEPQ